MWSLASYRMISTKNKMNMKKSLTTSNSIINTSLTNLCWHHKMLMETQKEAWKYVKMEKVKNWKRIVNLLAQTNKNYANKLLVFNSPQNQVLRKRRIKTRKESSWKFGEFLNTIKIYKD